MIEVQLSVMTMHGEMITEDFIETYTLCEYCGEKVKPNGKDHEPKWSEGGDILTDLRGRSRPPRYLAVSPGRGATEQKRIQTGPEYLLHRLLTRHRPRLRHPALNSSTFQTPQSTVKASCDGLVGYISSELVVLACPRSTRCLYCYKDFRDV